MVSIGMHHADGAGGLFCGRDMVRNICRQVGLVFYSILDYCALRIIRLELAVFVVEGSFSDGTHTRQSTFNKNALVAAKATVSRLSYK